MSAEARALTILLNGLRREVSDDEIDVTDEADWWSHPIHERLRRLLEKAEEELTNG